MPTTQIAAGAGFRRAMVFELSSAHLNLPAPPAVSSATAEAYLRFISAKTYSPTFPDPVIIPHTGDDGLTGQIMLPPNEPTAGTLTIGTSNLEIDALLQGINVVAEGDMQTIGRGVMPQAYAEVGLLFYRQAIDTDPASAYQGSDRWIWMMMPMAKVAPQSGPMEEGGDDVNTYNLMPQIVSKYLWGVAFALGVEGFDQAQIIQGISNGPPRFNSWLLAAATTSYDFSENCRADMAATGFAATIYGVDMDAGAIPAVYDITSECTISATSIDTTGVTAFTIADDDVLYAFFEGTTLW